MQWGTVDRFHMMKMMGDSVDSVCRREMISKYLFLKNRDNLSDEQCSRLDGLLFHSDRGSEYTCKEFRDLLDQCSVLQSFSAKGYPYDNSVCESFFKYLKMEETDRKHYRTREELRLDLFSYIDGYYNSKRIHSSIGYKTPNEIEKEFFMNNC